MALPILPSSISLWLRRRRSGTMPEGFPPAPCASRLSPRRQHPTSPRGEGDGVRHGWALPLAWPRSNFPPLCLPSLGSPSNLRSPTISLPLAPAGCSSSLERFTSAALPRALQHCAALSSPSAQRLRARVCRGVPPTNPLPSPQSELVGQLGSVPGMGLAMVDIQKLPLPCHTGLQPGASRHPLAGRCSSSAWGRAGLSSTHGCHQAQVG